MPKNILQILKYAFAGLCVIYMVSTFLPSAHVYRCLASDIFSRGLGRVIFVGDSVLFAAAFYCMHVRKPAGWKLVPAFIGLYWLITYLVPSIWFATQCPFLFTTAIGVVVISFVAPPFLWIWWKKQKSFFNSNIVV